MVWFDGDGDGRKEPIGWTKKDAAVAFLVLPDPRSPAGHPKVTSFRHQMFGVFTAQDFDPALEHAGPMGSWGRNGFAALKMWDRRDMGGNEDGKLTPEDMIWHGPTNNPNYHLMLWINSAHDGVFKLEEAHDLGYYGIVEIGLNYPSDYHKASITDKYGNNIAWEGKAKLADGSTLRIADVVFAVHQ